MPIMKEMGGAISDRIRSGEIPEETLNKGRDVALEPAPVDALCRCSGRGLGQGATRHGEV